MAASETLRLEKADRLSDPFIAAGDRAYLIGAQHGGFPDMGWHTPGEMWGVWAHPIKLLDGFWLQIDGTWIEAAQSFAVEQVSTTHDYNLEDGLCLSRRQFVPDGEAAVVVRYSIRSPQARVLKLRLLARTDLHAVWPGDPEASTGGHNQATYLPELGAWLCRHDRKSWFVVVGIDSARPEAWSCGCDLDRPELTCGGGISVTLDFSLEIGPNHQSHFDLVISGSSLSSDDACDTYRRVRGDTDSLFRSKQARYEKYLQWSGLAVPDSSIQRAWSWIKCDFDWLVRDVPGVGRGLGAGVDEYCWWFGCDNSYALLGALALGQHEVAIQTLDLIRSISVRANGDSGRVIHECNTRGEVTNPGCAQETPHHLTTVWETFCWTGDRAFLERNYEFCRKGLLEWTLGSCCPDSDLLPYGYGITECEGVDLQCIDTATHTVKALQALAEMAKVVSDESVAARCRTLAAQVRSRLEDAFWMEEEGLYGDMIATPAEMMLRIPRWIAAAESQSGSFTQTSAVVYELKRLLREAEADRQLNRKRPWLLKHWIVICPLVAGLTTPEKAARCLDRVVGAEFTGPWGMYLSGRDRTHAMSISTGALAVALGRYGRIDQALRYIRMLTDTLDRHMPGAISEMSPDYGCFVQAWSGYAVAWPLVAQIFGIQPDAYQRRLIVSPRIPIDWPEARLMNVRIGGSTFDFVWDGERFSVTAHESGWNVTSLTLPLAFQSPHNSPLRVS